MRHSLGLTPARVATLLMLLVCPPATAAGDDVQDLVYCDEARPLLIRMHLRAGGKPHVARWEGFFRKLHAYLDRDNNGVLDEEEVRRAPAPQQLTALMQSGNAYYIPAGVRPAFAEMDADGDGEVSPEEFLRYYRRAKIGPVQVAPTFYPGAMPDGLTDTLFAHLDKNKDGKLSQEELTAAPVVLGKYDLDDDEIVTAQELTAPGGSFRPLAPVGRVRMRGRMPGRPVQPLFLVPAIERGQRAARRLAIARVLLDRYDQDRDQKLSRKEIGLPRKWFDRLDRNHDSLLDSLELMHWPPAVPDAEVVIHLGAGEGKAPMEVLAPAGKPKGPGTPSLTLGSTRINLVRAQAIVYRTGMRDYLAQLFRTIDKDKKGFITARQAEAPQFALLRGILTLADRDGDGKFTMKELTAWQDLMESAPGSMASIIFAETGRGLFQMLDANRDGRLNVRELRSAWARLKEFDSDHDGCIACAEIPRHVQITINRGGPNYLYARSLPGAIPPGRRSATRGPLWFLKMDANGDGDVSRREFLGTEEQFRRIDADGDGFISAEEAERFDAALRGKK